MGGEGGRPGVARALGAPASAWQAGRIGRGVRRAPCFPRAGPGGLSRQRARLTRLPETSQTQAPGDPASPQQGQPARPRRGPGSLQLGSTHLASSLGDGGQRAGDGDGEGAGQLITCRGGERTPASAPAARCGRTAPGPSPAGPRGSRAAAGLPPQVGSFAEESEISRRPLGVKSDPSLFNPDAAPGFIFKTRKILHHFFQSFSFPVLFFFFNLVLFVFLQNPVTKTCCRVSPLICS